MDEKPTPQPMSTAEFFRSISDPQKLELLNAMLATMDPGYKQHIINQLAGQQAAAGGEVSLNISSNETSVRLDFGKALAWFVIPKEHAIQIGMLLIEHGGGQVVKSGELQQEQKPPINVKPM